jgi:hypothetical protein
MSRFAVVLLGILWLAGCARSDSPTGPKTGTAGESRTVSADLRDRFLLDHNAAFNGGVTFRWVPPIPIYVITGDEFTDNLIMEQFLAWEVALAGAGGTPFYEPQPIAQRVPQRGIFLAVADLPDNVVGLGDPFSEFAQRPRQDGVRAAQIRRLRLPQAAGRVEVPQISADSETQTCALVLDPVLLDGPETPLRSVIRHEVGHCLGFIGHVSTGLMKPTCCALNITSDVRNMMRKLYNNPPGTPVTR